MESIIPLPTKETPENAPLVENYLKDGKLADGEKALIARLNANKLDDQARFGLGLLQFLQAVEKLSQDLYHYGLRDFAEYQVPGPIGQFHVGGNPKPAKIDYLQFRNIVDSFDKKLVQAEATLAGITSPDVKLPLHFGLIRLDLNGDGKVGDDDYLWKLYTRLERQRTITQEQADSFYIKFDRGDVHWLRGYCHVFMTLCEFYLAHDAEDTFKRSGNLFFQKVDTPYDFLDRKTGKKLRHTDIELGEILDVVALIHTINWQVTAPERMEAALHHMEAVVAQSRESWKFIMAETDDDHEWLPNPRQTGALPNMKVTEEMVHSWAEIMNEFERILNGEHLIPFWRGADGRGVNVRKVFLKPERFDLVLWVQGTAASPYLERGELSKGDTWRALTRDFGSQFPGFALWFN